MTNLGFNSLLTANNFKINKSNNKIKDYYGCVMHLSPWKISGYGNVCPQASPICSKVCLNLSGRGVYSSVQKARTNRTKFFFEYRDEFFDLLKSEIKSFVKKCDKLGKKPCIRLNCLSDLPFETLCPELFIDFRQCTFWDYTKIYSRALKFAEGKLPPNYDLTFSRSEINEQKCLDLLRRGINIAVVYNGKMPKKWHNYRCIDGDENDFRFLDAKPRVIMLKAKGKARKYMNGDFVINQLAI